MKKSLILSFFASALLLVSACETQVPAGPSLNFKRYQPIYMNVATIEVVEDYKSPNRAPNVEHLMPYSPADAVHIWVKDRLRATAQDKKLEVIIKDASVIDSTPPEPDGFAGVFSIGQTHNYKARLEIEFRIYGAAALSEASINVVATRDLSMSGNASAATRNLYFREMIFDMMTVVNAELEKNIFEHLGSYVNFSMNP
jgi:hypothetical protein